MKIRNRPTIPFYTDDPDDPHWRCDNCKHLTAFDTCELTGQEYIEDDFCTKFEERKKRMRVYLSGMISKDKDYISKFRKAELEIRLARAVSVFNPAELYIIMPHDADYSEYMWIDKAMIDLSDAIIMLPDWQNSEGARFEREYARITGKAIYDYEDFIQEVEP